jgi:hypothetical protein
MTTNRGAWPETPPFSLLFGFLGLMEDAGSKEPLRLHCAGSPAKVPSLCFSGFGPLKRSFHEKPPFLSSARVFAARGANLRGTGHEDRGRKQDAT